MSDYTKLTNFATKDSLPSGNANKIIRGTEIDAEFNSLQSAIATKQDKLSTVSVTDTTTVLSGPLRVNGAVSNGTNSAVLIPSDTTTNRPASPVVGQIRYNTTLGRYEGWNGSVWRKLEITEDGDKGIINVYSSNVKATGTYSQVASTLMTITSAAHGLTTGDTVLLTFTSGAGVSGKYTVTVVTVDTFTITASTTATTTSGNVTISSYWDIKNKSITGDKIADGALAPSNFSGQSGSAPVYGIRAWVNFDGTITDNIGGTYSRDASTTVTVTTTVAHGLNVGHIVFLDFTSGTATDGVFTVTAVTSSTVFTVTHTASGVTSGNVTLNRRKINASGNVSNVAYLAIGEFVINFTVDMPDVNYAVSGVTTDNNNYVVENNLTARTKSAIRIGTRSDSGSFQNPATYCSLMFIR